MLSINLMETQMVTLNKLNLTKMNLTLWIQFLLYVNLKMQKLLTVADIYFLKLIKFTKTIIYRMGLSESSLTTITKPFSC